MYAVVVTGGKQYRVAEGDVLNVEKLGAEVGENVELDKVLMVKNDGDVKLGKPYVEGASVQALVKEQGKGDKVNVIKFKRRKNYRKKQGHRQLFTRLEITAINAG